MTISAIDALCCAISSVQLSAANADAEPFDHAYPTSAMTWPYCSHSAVIGRLAGISNVPPPNRDYLVAENPQTTGTIRYHRFDISVIRCGPPSPDENSTKCLGDLYGDCSSPANHETLAGHERSVDLEVERLMGDMLDLWCDCLVDLPEAQGGRYSKTRPRWIESASVTSQGRFTAIEFKIGTLLA